MTPPNTTPLIGITNVYYPDVTAANAPQPEFETIGYIEDVPLKPEMMTEIGMHLTKERAEELLKELRKSNHYQSITVWKEGYWKEQGCTDAKYCERDPDFLVNISLEERDAVRDKITRAQAIEECAEIVDRLNREGPYQSIGAAKEIRALKTGGK
jgi:hypothetical protein